MKRFRDLDRYPKFLLIALVVMAVFFSAVYGITASRVGYLYCDTILVPRQVDGATLYEGRLGDADCIFTVTADTVTLVCGKTYGPYTIHEDPSAIPADDTLAPYMTGIVIMEGEQTFFRGGLMDSGEDLYLFHEDGSIDYTFTVTMSDSVEYDMNGNPVNPYAPTAYTILALLRGPELTHKGEWTALFLGFFLSAILAVDILFADELFRFRISFRVQDAANAEPSDWELASRIIGWTILTIVTFFDYMLGLQ